MPQMDVLRISVSAISAGNFTISVSPYPRYAKAARMQEPCNFVKSEYGLGKETANILATWVGRNAQTAMGMEAPVAAPGKTV